MKKKIEQMSKEICKMVVEIYSAADLPKARHTFAFDEIGLEEISGQPRNYRREVAR